MITPTLYTQDTISQLEIPDSELGRLLKCFWLPLMELGTQHYFDNVQTELQVLALDELVLPVTVNQWCSDNSYVCSPYAHYITYAKEELYMLQSPYLERILRGLLTGMGTLVLMGKIDQTVMVNNWLLSTNLYPPIEHRQIKLLTAQLVQQFPKAAIIFRSLNTYQHHELLRNFYQSQYHLMASRQVYLFSPLHPTRLKSKIRWRLKQDRNLYQQTGYEVISREDLVPSDISRLTELYTLLYIDKYCENNPQFNSNFLKLALYNEAFVMKALRKKGRIDGVIGFYQLNGTMTTPLLGYDTALPQSLGLYRMLSSLLMQEASQRKLILHQSSGAASFKRFRGFTGYMEYSAAYIQHLPIYRQGTWKALQLIANGIGMKIVKRFQL